SEAVSKGSSGVRTATGAMRAAAAVRSARVMRLGMTWKLAVGLASGRQTWRCPPKADNDSRRALAGCSSEDPVPPTALGLVQRAVRVLEEHLRRDRVGATREGDADTDRQPDRASGGAKREVVHLAPKALGEGERALPSGVREHDDELVAAGAGHGVGVAGRRLH